MEYKQLSVEAFEREPGKWRARVRRLNGEPIKIIGRKKVDQFVTSFDAKTAAAAMGMAMAVIDAETFAGDRVPAERLWRLKRASARISDSGRSNPR
jgi:hypothetical protein